jgi:hypothetical protein
VKKWMNAKIKWLSEKEGGRRMPVPVVSSEQNNNRYCPIIVFQNTITNGASWSADIYVQSQIDKYESIAKISYLFENAPFDLLREGANFELYEGNRLVARGTIGSELKL